MKGRHKEGHELVRALTRAAGGNSYSVTLPIAVIRDFGWERRQRLELTVDAKKKTITIADWKK